MNNSELFCLYVIRGSIVLAAISSIIALFNWQIGATLTGFFLILAGIACYAYNNWK